MVCRLCLTSVWTKISPRPLPYTGVTCGTNFLEHSLRNTPILSNAVLGKLHGSNRMNGAIATTVWTLRFWGWNPECPRLGEGWGISSSWMSHAGLLGCRGHWGSRMLRGPTSPRLLREEWGNCKGRQESFLWIPGRVESLRADEHGSHGAVLMFHFCRLLCPGPWTRDLDSLCLK